MNKFSLLLSKAINRLKSFKVYRFSVFLSRSYVYIMLASLSAIFLTPFIYMIGHSLMNVNDLVNSNIKWLPTSFNIDNYMYAIRSLNYFPTLLYSSVITVICVFAQVFTCSFVGYGLARIKFRGSGVIFALIIFTLIIPPQTVIVPQYILFSKAGGIDSYLPIIIPCFFSLGLSGGLFTFIFRQFYKAMPKELENAALIDGTGIIGAYFKIMFPNATSPILITTILSLVWQWNNFFEPSIYIRNISKGTLTLQLSQLQQTALSFNVTNFNKAINLAATFLCVLPIVVFFLIIQRKFMKSIETSGLAN